jgi:8-oxo-dGTP pyrophosphatase MutT (NUDIX family)
LPTSSPAQNRLMEAAAHTPGGYGGVPQRVGKEFVRADTATTRAAGIMFLTKADETLLLKRGPGGDYPGFWCFPGGTTEDGETAEETATRETEEELGFLPDGDRIPWVRRIANNEIAGTVGETVNPELPPTDSIVVPVTQVDFTTFLQKVPDRFDPKLNGEHTGFAWVSPQEPPEPLHPGARIALNRLTMNELDVARAIAAGELTSPQKYDNVWLFALRITGTGKSYRSAIKEHVWRDPSLYLNDEFLARCNGLSVIWVHPKKGLLDSDEFADRIIGSIFVPYIQGDEVWGIAKVYDDLAAQEMKARQISTSPGVRFADPSVNSTITLEDGTKVLIEGDPSLWDHVAVVPLGVWDKSGPPSGVLNNALEERADAMAESAEEKKAREEREDAARRDAGAPIDKVLAHLDAMSKRMDAMEGERRADKRRDAQARRDAERDDWRKADAAACERDDAEEEAEREKYKADGMDEDMAADKARKDRRDRMDKRRADAESEEAKKAKADAEEKEREDKARRDADERAEKERADAIKADAQTAAALAVQLANMPKSPNDPDYAAMAEVQARADAAYQALGKRAPAALQGESLIGYRRRLVRGVQSYSPDWKKADLTTAAEEILNIAEGKVYTDAITASHNVDDLADGELVKSVRTSETGHLITSFRGRTTIFKKFSAPTMRATAFLTERRA